MTYGLGPINSQTAFLTDDFYIPEDAKLAIEQLNKRASLTARVVNLREIGQYETSELICGQTWFRTDSNPSIYGRSQQTRYAYRRCFDLVELNNGFIPMGITTLRIAPKIQTIIIPTRGFGTATISGPQYMFFPDANITFSFDNSNPEKQAITINNGTAFVLEQCYITIEYLKQS